MQLTFFSLFSKGKRCQADCLQVLQKYFMHILCRLGNPMLDSICDAKHLHQPTFKRKVLCFSYKIFNKETFERVLGGKTCCSFGQGHYLETTTKCLTCQRFQQKEALANARARKQDRRATSCSLLEIGPGEGLCMRGRIDMVAESLFMVLRVCQTYFFAFLGRRCHCSYIDLTTDQFISSYMWKVF